MKKIELVWNIVFYFTYRIDYLFHLIFNKINPGFLINKLPFQKRMLERKGIDLKQEVNKAFKDPKFGISSMRAASFMFIMCAFIGMFFFCIWESLFKENLPPTFMIIPMIPFCVFTFFTLFYKNKYLAYFKDFEQKPKEWKIKWAWITLGIILLILSLLVLGFNIETYSFHH